MTTSPSELKQTIAAAPAAGASAALMAAAIGGLLCLAGCGSDDPGPHEGGPADENKKITLSRVDPEITKESFEESCMQVAGKIEVHPSCGGANSCKGFSYDTDTLVYTEHTCQGLNTCTGYSCVVPDEQG